MTFRNKMLNDDKNQEESSIPVARPALAAGPFSLTCLTKMVSIGTMGSNSPADIPRCHSSGQSCIFFN
jgi:hypothetical protein